MRLIPPIKYVIGFATLAFLLPSCDTDNPSGFGAKLQDRLEAGKQDFERQNFDAMLNSSPVKGEAKEILSWLANSAQEVSRGLKTEWAKEGVERSELALACLIAQTEDPVEMARLRDNLAASMDITDPRGIASLGLQLNQYRVQLVQVGFYREKCR